MRVHLRLKDWGGTRSEVRLAAATSLEALPIMCINALQAETKMPPKATSGGPSKRCLNSRRLSSEHRFLRRSTDFRFLGHSATHTHSEVAASAGLWLFAN